MSGSVLFTCVVFLAAAAAYRPAPPSSQPQCVNANEVSVKVDPKSYKERTCELRSLPQPSCNHKNCESRCVCKDGYYKNYLGDCISAKECDKCRGSNEFYACNSACDNECSTLGSQNRTNCPIVNIKCNEKCYCKDGFSRDKNNKCIPTQKCPTPKCGENEEFVPCKHLCPPEICFAIVAFYDCDPKEPCQPKCACKPGHYRITDKSPCIPSHQCP